MQLRPSGEFIGIDICNVNNVADDEIVIGVNGNFRGNKQHRRCSAAGAARRGPQWAFSVAASSAVSGIGARSAHPELTRRACLSGVSEAKDSAPPQP